jgi:hypothetical protein
MNEANPKGPWDGDAFSAIVRQDGEHFLATAGDTMAVGLCHKAAVDRLTRLYPKELYPEATQVHSGAVTYKEGEHSVTRFPANPQVFGIGHSAQASFERADANFERWLRAGAPSNWEPGPEPAAVTTAAR